MRSRKPEVYSHPHFAPQRIPMDNHRMENCRPQVNIISPIVLEATIVETWRQFVRIGIIQSQIGSTTKLGSGSGGILTRRKLNGSSTLPTTTTRVVGTPQMVFTNLILIIHVYRITNQPPMSSMDVGGYKSANAMNPKRGYQKPSIIITPIPNYRDGHYVRPNKVALKYHDFRKDVDPNAHVRMFNFVIKTNIETSKKYIINAFNYKLKDTT